MVRSASTLLSVRVLGGSTDLDPPRIDHTQVVIMVRGTLGYLGDTRFEVVSLPLVLLHLPVDGVFLEALRGDRVSRRAGGNLTRPTSRSSFHGISASRSALGAPVTEAAWRFRGGAPSGWTRVHEGLR